MQITNKCDVYSFGVVALELVMGKHPRDLLAYLSSMKPMLEMEDTQMFLKDVLDERLPPPTGRLAAAVVVVVTIALACTRRTPSSRPSMRLVAQELSFMKQPGYCKPFGKITIGNLARCPV